MNNGLTPAAVAEVHRVLSRYPTVDSAVLYGSRAKGEHRQGSDIDLVLTGPRLDHRTLSRISGDFEDGPLPQRVDVALLDDIQHPALLDHIKRVGVVLYQREPATAAT